MNTLLHDLSFCHSPDAPFSGFAVTAVFILALGIAANVIVFGVLQAILLQPLDVAHPDRVIQLAHTSPSFPVFAYPEMRDVRDNNHGVFCCCRLYRAGFWPGSQRRYPACLGYEVSGNTSRPAP